MGRSGYYDDFGDEDPLALGRWRSAVRNAIRGKRGQAFLKEFIADLDAMPVKRLIAETFADNEAGEFCSLGVVFAARKLEQPVYSPDDYDDWAVGEDAAARLKIAGAMAHEIIYWNDEGGRHDETPEARWTRMRQWASNEITTSDTRGEANP